MISHQVFQRNAHALQASAARVRIIEFANVIETAGNLLAFDDGYCHATINVDQLDPECALTTLIVGEPRRLKRAETILNNSFGMLGINSVLIVKRFTA